MPAIAMKKEIQVEAKTLSIHCKVSDRFTASLSRGTNGTTISTTFEIVSIVDYKSAGHTLTMQCREVQ